MRRSSPIFVALRWVAALALAASAMLAQRAVACPLSDDECAGIVRDLSQLERGAPDALEAFAAEIERRQRVDLGARSGRT